MKQRMATVLVVLVAHLLVQSAQAFPDRPIKLVVPSPAGGPPDVMARLLSDKMAASLGQPVVVDNRGGAGGTIGARSVLGAEADGYTLLMGSTSTLLIAPAIYRNAGYHAGLIRAGRSGCGQHRGPRRASVGSRQIRSRIGQPGEVQAGYVEFRFGGGWNASPYRRRAPEGARADRHQPRSLSRRRPGPHGLLGGQIEVLFSR